MFPGLMASFLVETNIFTDAKGSQCLLKSSSSDAPPVFIFNIFQVLFNA